MTEYKIEEHEGKWVFSVDGKPRSVNVDKTMTYAFAFGYLSQMANVMELELTKLKAQFVKANGP